MNCIRIASLAAALGLASAVSAQVISVNFRSTRPDLFPGFASTDPGLAASAVAGVVPAANWNNAPVGNAGATYVDLLDLVDNSGAATTADINYVNQSWATDAFDPNVAPTNTSDHRMMFSFTGDVNAGHTITVSDIPYGLYDLYVYVGRGWFFPGSFNVDAALTAGATSITKYVTFGNFDGTFTESNSTVSGVYAAGEYIVFPGLTSSSLAVAFNGFGTAAAVPGLQIVAVPEPATYGAIAAGAALLAVLARRRRS